MRPVIYSAIQPSGSLHLGNYIGAIQGWVRLQNKPHRLDSVSSVPKEASLIFAIADLHAITTTFTSGIYRETLLCAAGLLACGIDATRSSLIRQSKEKGRNFGGHAGLLSYPILQAADIILHRSELVPVGADQTQHLEFTAAVATRLTKPPFCLDWPIPSPLILGKRIMNFRNPLVKMSKSDKLQKDGVIFLFESPDEIFRKIKMARSDSTSTINTDIESRPALSNMLSIICEIMGTSHLAFLNAHPEIYNFHSLKLFLADFLISHLAPFRERYNSLCRDDQALEAILDDSEAKISPQANKNYLRILSAFIE